MLTGDLSKNWFDSGSDDYFFGYVLQNFFPIKIQKLMNKTLIIWMSYYQHQQHLLFYYFFLLSPSITDFRFKTMFSLAGVFSWKDCELHFPISSAKYCNASLIPTPLLALTGKNEQLYSYLYFYIIYFCFSSSSFSYSYDFISILFASRTLGISFPHFSSKRSNQSFKLLNDYSWLIS